MVFCCHSRRVRALLLTPTLLVLGAGIVHVQWSVLARYPMHHSCRVQQIVCSICKRDAGLCCGLHT